MHEAPAPVLAGLGGLHDRVGGVRGSAWWRAAPARSRSRRRSPHSRHWRSATHSSPSSRQRWQTGSATVSTAGYRSRSSQVRAGHAGPTASPQLPALLGGDVEHRLLDVEQRQHVGDHLGGDLPRRRGSPAPARARPRASPAGPGRRGRWATPGRRRCRAAPRPRSCAGRAAAGSGRRRRAGRRTRARRARCSAAFDACWSRVARASASSAGSGPGTRSRRASHGSDMPWMNSVPATTVNAISSSTSRCGCPPG